MGVGIEACRDGDFPFFEFGRRIYLSFDDLAELYKTVDELVRAIQAEQRHVERREPGRPQPSFVDQWSAGIDRKYDRGSW
jgi:hypothetical protein